MTEKFELTSADRHSSLWARLEKYYEERLANLRMQNDGNTPETTTAHTRGRIAEVKVFLALGQESKVVL